MRRRRTAPRPSLHASGFLAVYLAALLLGNARLPHRPATRGFVEGMGWLAQIGLFVMLGLLATPSELGGSILPALGIGLVLLLVARPLSVLAVVLPFRLPAGRRCALLSWAGLRGAVPVVLATVPADDDVFNLVFVLVVVFTLVQAPTLPLGRPAARAHVRRRGDEPGHRVLAADCGWTPTCCRRTSPKGRASPASRSSS